jgi:hypothetical protein
MSTTFFALFVSFTTILGFFSCSACHISILFCTSLTIPFCASASLPSWSNSVTYLVPVCIIHVIISAILSSSCRRDSCCCPWLFDIVESFTMIAAWCARLVILVDIHSRIPKSDMPCSSQSTW